MRSTLIFGLLVFIIFSDAGSGTRSDYETALEGINPDIIRQARRIARGTICNNMEAVFKAKRLKIQADFKNSNSPQVQNLLSTAHVNLQFLKYSLCDTENVELLNCVVVKVLKEEPLPEGFQHAPYTTNLKVDLLRAGITLELLYKS